MSAGSRVHFKMQITFLNNRGPGILSQMSHRLSVFTKVSSVIALDVECPPASMAKRAPVWSVKTGAVRGSRVGERAGVGAHLNPGCVIVSKDSSYAFVRENEKNL